MTKTIQEKIAVMQAFADGAKVEYRPKRSDWDCDWVASTDPVWDWNYTDYRIAPPAPEMPDEIDWSHVSPEYNFMARPQSETYAYLFKRAPYLLHGVWLQNEALATRTTEPFASYKRGTVSWDKSLVIRPEYEGGAK